MFVLYSFNRVHNKLSTNQEVNGIKLKKSYLKKKKKKNPYTLLYSAFRKFGGKQ